MNSFALRAEPDFNIAASGTLLSFYSTTVDPGHLSVNPYLLFTTTYGSYKKNWSLENQENLYEAELFLFLTTGLTRYADINLVLDGIYSKVKNYDHLQIADVQLYLGIQLLRESPNTNIPDFRLIVGESFPSGKYDNLSEIEFLSDGVGEGSYQTFLGFALQKSYYIYDHNPLYINFSFLYFLSSNSSIKEYSIFGGGVGTEGTISVGDAYFLNLGLEYRINDVWSIALDSRFDHQNSSRFSGNKGLETNEFFLDSSEQFSLAPSLEYHRTQDLVIIIGPWFSIAGRNTSAFASLVNSVAYYF